MSGDKLNPIPKTPNVEGQEDLLVSKKSSELKNKLINEAKQLIEKNKLKGDVLVAEEYQEFLDRIEKESLTLKQSIEVDKNLEKKLGQEELNEFKSNIQVISKIKKYSNSDEFENFVNDNISDEKLEKLYKKINKIDNLDSILIYLFNDKKLPTNKTELRNLFKSNRIINKDYKSIEKETEQLLNNSDTKIDDIDNLLKKINKISNVLNESKLNKLGKIKVELKDKEVELKINEKQKEEKEKQKEEKEKQKEEKRNLSIIEGFGRFKDNSIFDNLKYNEIISKVLDGEYEIGGKDIDNLSKAISEIIEVLKKGKGENLKKFIEEEAVKGGKEAYTKAVSFVKSLGDNSLNIYITKIPDFPHINGEIQNFPKNLDDFTKKQLMDSLGVMDMSEIIQNGDIFTVGDKQIIFEDGEAVLYNLSENGYRMESDIAEMGDEYRKINSFKVKINFIKEEYKNIGDEINGIKLEKNSFIEDVKYGKASITQEEFDNKILKYDTRLNEKINYLKVLEKKAKKITLNYKTFLENNQFRLDEDLEEKQKETLKFLSKIGFDLIPQSITEQLIKNINLAPSYFGFDSQIDLENGDLGMRGFGDDYMTSEYKEIFMKVFIKAIGNPKMDGKNIFNKDNVNNSSTVTDPVKLNLYLNINGYKGFGAFNKMKENLITKKNSE